MTKRHALLLLSLLLLPARSAPPPRRIFLQLHASTLLASELRPEHLRAAGVTDLVLYWAEGDRRLNLYSDAFSESATTDLFLRVRTKIGPSLRLWPVHWSFNDRAWSGRPTSPYTWHLAGEWTDDAAWSTHSLRLQAYSRALLACRAAGVILDLENYGATKGASGGMMEHPVWNGGPTRIAARASQWWSSLTRSGWNGQPGFYVHWADARRWPGLKTWCRTVYRKRGGGLFLFEDSFSATINNRDYGGTAALIRRALGRCRAVPGYWVTEKGLTRSGLAPARQMLRQTGALWLYQDSGEAVLARAEGLTRLREGLR